MTTQILFLQGAGSGAYEEDKRLVESLQHALGPGFEIRYPVIQDDGEASYHQWRTLIDEELTGMSGPVIMVGHSVGGSVLAKWLSDGYGAREIGGVFLIASPFWGGDGWRYEGYEELELPAGFAAKPSQELPIYLYHCRDDATVPFEHLSLFAQVMPQATVRALDDGGHQLGDDISVVARDITALPWID